MSLTKEKLAEIIREDLGGGDPESNTKYHDLVLFQKIEIALNAMIFRNFIEHRNENSYDINGDFITPFANVKVEEDSVRDEKFSILPARIISLPDNRGLRQVSPLNGQDSAFVRVPNGSNDTFSDLEANSLDGKTGYYVEGNKIFYRNIGEDIDQVLIKMVASITDLPEDQPIPIPAEYEMDLLNAVKALCQEEKTTTQDNYNDANNQQI